MDKERDIEIDPYKFLQVSHNFTAKELKIAYKKAVLMYHPDSLQSTQKSEYLFNIATASYKKLVAIHNAKINDKQFYELKKESYIERKEAQTSVGDRHQKYKTK